MSAWAFASALVALTLFGGVITLAGASGVGRGRRAAGASASAISDPPAVATLAREVEAAMEQSIRRYLAELIGTFALVFIGTSAATLQGYSGWGTGAGMLGIAFAFGGTLMVLVLVIGPVSGCHVNPAVTIPMAICGRLKWNLVPGYIIAQLIGAAAASALLLVLMNGLKDFELIKHGIGANGNPTDMATGALLGWEIVLTALFLFTIFAATRDDATPGFAALAIGGFLFVAHVVGAQLGDSSVNPARSFGPALFTGGDALKLLWIFIVGPIAGGIVGWLLYRVVYND